MKELKQLDTIVRSLKIKPLILESVGRLKEADEKRKVDRGEKHYTEQLLKLNERYGTMQTDFLSLIKDYRERLESDPSLTEQLTVVLENAVQLLESKPILLAAINGAYQSMKGAMLDISPGTPFSLQSLRGIIGRTQLIWPKRSITDLLNLENKRRGITAYLRKLLKQDKPLRSTLIGPKQFWLHWR